MTKTTFQEFLEDKYDELDNDSNNMNEAFEGRRDRWFENLDTQELIDYGQEYADWVVEYVILDIVDELQRKI